MGCERAAHDRHDSTSGTMIKKRMRRRASARPSRPHTTHRHRMRRGAAPHHPTSHAPCRWPMFSGATDQTRWSLKDPRCLQHSRGCVGPHGVVSRLGEPRPLDTLRGDRAVGVQPSPSRMICMNSAKSIAPSPSRSKSVKSLSTCVLGPTFSRPPPKHVCLWACCCKAFLRPVKDLVAYTTGAPASSTTQVVHPRDAEHRTNSHLECSGHG